jgi:hypothetical protein
LGEGPKGDEGNNQVQESMEFCEGGGCVCHPVCVVCVLTPPPPGVSPAECHPSACVTRVCITGCPTPVPHPPAAWRAIMAWWKCA